MAEILGVGRGYALLGLVLVIAVLMSLAPIHHVAVEGARSSSKEEDSELEAQLKILNKPPVKTIQTEWGDILDCVDIYKQPAFDHPLLKNHKIQMKPTSVPQRVRDEISSTLIKHKTLGFRTPVEKCPKGTVPIRRTQKEDLVQAKSLSSSRTIFSGSKNDPKQYKTGILYQNEGESYYGVTGAMEVYNPKVAQDQFSTSEMALEAGPGYNWSGIHFGWRVNPQLYRDNLTRTFTYWTGDGGKTSGCYNTLCSGFVQVHQQVTPGTPLPKTSTYGGTIYAFNARVFQDTNGSMNWWLQYGENYDINVGYWPRSLFPLFTKGASSVYWGGHVKAGGDGSSPEMGTGHLPDDDYTRSSFFENMQFIDEHKILHDPNNGNIERKNGCPMHYGLKFYGHLKGVGHTFLFGGPGGKCD